MQYLYGWSWHEDGRHPIDEMTEEEARKAFAKGPQVAVIALLEPGGVPAYTLEMSADAEDVRVIQYTPEGSVAANLDYSVPDGEDRLFLEEVGEWLYPDDGSFHSMAGAIAFREYFFTPEGTVEVRSRLSGAEAERSRSSATSMLPTSGSTASPGATGTASGCTARRHPISLLDPSRQPGPPGQAGSRSAAWRSCLTMASGSSAE